MRFLVYFFYFTRMIFCLDSSYFCNIDIMASSLSIRITRYNSFIKVVHMLHFVRLKFQICMCSEVRA